MIKEYMKYGYVLSEPTVYPYIEDDLHELLKQASVYKGNKTACLLSGGLDSSLACALARKFGRVDTFTCVFEGEGSGDLYPAIDVAKHLSCAHDIIYMRKEVVVKDFPSIMRLFDKPVDETGIVPLFYAYRQLKERGYDTIITGDGGDELFGGYKHCKLAFLKGGVMEWEIDHHLMDKHVFVAETLAKAIGINVVSPFLDKRVIAKAYHMPVTQKISWTKDKKPLRKIAKEYLPHKSSQRAKYYFHNPVQKWLGCEGKMNKREFFLDTWIKSRTQMTSV